MYKKNHNPIYLPVCLVLIVLIIAAFPGCKPLDKSQSVPAVEIPSTEKQLIHSDIIGQDYDLFIHLPGGYYSSEKSYPVIYLLDAQWDFPLVTAIYGQQYFDGFLPELIIVGVLWAGEKPNHDSLRVRDFTPTKNPLQPQSGGADNFLASLRKEIIPFVDKKYRTQNDRTIMGSSLGGLFALYALFKEPDLFQRYICTSAYTAYDNDILYKFEQQYKDKNPFYPIHLFMAYGGLEPSLPIFHQLVNLLKKRNYSNLSWDWKVLEDIGHSGSKAEGFTRGLQFVFKRPSFPVDTTVLQKFTGEYESQENYVYKITFENNAFTLNFPDNETRVLKQKSATEFYVLGEFLNIRFAQDAAGKVTGFEIDHFGGSEYLKKIK